MMYSIESEILKVTVQQKGAELDSIFNRANNQEYLWSGDAAFWGKKSPVLFPVVGTLKNDTYYTNGKSYHLSRHGFARELLFEVSSQTANTITFTLRSNDDTYQKFPFHFRFDIIYAVTGNLLSVTYRVTNTGKAEMFFSVGGHPAFRLPLTAGSSYSDYYLEFSEEENAGRWPISKEGLIEKTSIQLLDNSRRLPLTKELFHNDAIVLKNLRSDKVKLKSDKSAEGIEFDFTGFPYLGLWAAKNADFICIEPWCGIADSVDADQQLETKEGINKLEADEVFERTWRVTLF
jgi:galactose mutarotase-like enzyme